MYLFAYRGIKSHARCYSSKGISRNFCPLKRCCNINRNFFSFNSP
uniref:Uncharacterized protein n=1 Tax=Rhizophora mucronata TaxID=61149 RepID=A0A2P2QZ01_RHIMU